MQKSDLILRSRHVVTPEGVRAATIVAAGGVIRQIKAWEDAPGEVIDVGEAWILPGIVDVHVHINEPGRTDWEGFATATRAAAAGGITTLVDMPLNSSPVTTTLPALHQKLEASREKLHVDVAFHAGLIRGNASRIAGLIDAGCVGVKAFLVHSGIDEFPNATEADLREAMPVLAKKNVPLLVHAELEGQCAAAGAGEEARRYAAYLATRPGSWEHEAIAMMIRLCRDTGCPVHIVHLASASALPMLADARRDGLPITVETCPHYLFFDQGDIADGDTRFKCAPPIRDAANREGLWKGLIDGQIDLIASDHSPCDPLLKQLDRGDFTRAWGGISSLQWMLPIVWTEARQRGVPLDQVARWLAERPARLVRLDNKGRLAAGCDADLVVFHPDRSFTVEAEGILHRHKVTPYEGEVLDGVVERTYLRGQPVFQEGRVVGPAGRMILRTPDALTRLNHLPAEALKEALARCCGSRKWVAHVARSRPFTSLRQLSAASEEIWEAMTREDWMEAFSHHPKIGDVDSLRRKFATTAEWAAGEQAGAAAATEEVLRALAGGNDAYQRKFGYLFIVCATGKSAAEMLAILESRLVNPGDKELAIAAGEQMKITRLRLEKLLA